MRQVCLGCQKKESKSAIFTLESIGSLYLFSKKRLTIPGDENTRISAPEVAKSNCGKGDVWGTRPHTCAYNGGTKCTLSMAEIIYGEKCTPTTTICHNLYQNGLYHRFGAQVGVYTPAIIATHSCMLKKQIKPYSPVIDLRTVYPRAYRSPDVRPLPSMSQVS